MVIGSAEWQRPIRSKGVETNWESALFVDGGAVSNSVGDLRPVFGAGVGARWKSPLGPLQVDLAYGFKTKDVRLAHEHRGHLLSSLVVRGLKGLAILVAAVVALLVLLAAGLWWWTGTEGSAAWTLQQLARYQPVTAEGVQGALRSGLQARRLSWEAEGLKVEATDVQLAWQPLALLSGMVQLDHVRAAVLRIEDHRPPKPKVVPRVAGDPVANQRRRGQGGPGAMGSGRRLIRSFGLGRQLQLRRLAAPGEAGQPALGDRPLLGAGERGGAGHAAGRCRAGGPDRNAGAGQHAKAPAGLHGDAAWSDDRSSSSCLARGANGFAQRHRPCDSDCARDALGGAACAAGAGRISTAGPGRVVAAGAAHQPGRASSVAAGGDGDLGADHRTHERAARPLGQAAASGGTAARKRRMATVGAGTGAQPGSAGGWWKHPGQRPVAEAPTAGRWKANSKASTPPLCTA